MYTNLGYIVYRTVLEYYAGDVDEDAYGRILLISFFFFNFIQSRSIPHNSRQI